MPAPKLKEEEESEEDKLILPHFKKELNLYLVYDNTAYKPGSIPD